MEGESPNKRASTTYSNAFDNPLIRRTVVGPAAPVTFDAPPFQYDEANGDFQDAHEELPGEIYDEELQRRTSENYQKDRLALNASQAEDEEMKNATDSNMDMGFGEAMDLAENPEWDQDLFNTTLRISRSPEGEDENAESVKDESAGPVDAVEGDDDDEQEGDNTDSNESEEGAEDDIEDNTAREMPNEEPEVCYSEADSGLAAVKKSSVEPHGSTTLSTGVELPTGPVPPNPDKDLCKNLIEFEKFKNRAVDLIPCLPLAEKRYWIGVLHENVRTKTVKNETDFLWMKGNRLTTVSTVWYTYSTTTASEGFVLLLGHQRPGFNDRMEELDYFNEKKIIFRAMNEKSAFAKGKEMCEGVIPPEIVQSEVIELD